MKGMPMIEDIYALCTAQPKPFSEKLYYTLKEFLSDHVKAIGKNMMDSDSDVLSDYRNRWKTYRSGLLYIHHIFRYLNNNWIRKTVEDGRNRLGGLFQSDSSLSTKEVHEVYTLGLHLWKDEVFVVMKDRLIKKVIELVTAQRDGERIDGDLCSAMMESLVAMGLTNKNKPLELYKDNYETFYVDAAKEYYTLESLSFIDENGVSAYMKKAEQRIAEEEARSKRFLDKSSLERVRKEIDAVLIEKHKEILQVECETYLDRVTNAVNGKESPDILDLKRMYGLLSRITDGVEPMLSVLRKYVVSYVQAKVEALGKKIENPGDFCEVLLESYETFSGTVVEHAFQNDPKFVQSLDKALRVVINKRDDSAELVARYCDALLKKGKNKIELDDLDAKLKALVTIFKYLEDKDVFQKFYSKYLAR